MEHNLFKPENLEIAKHAAVGNCNNYSMEERYAQETPVFARNILKYVRMHGRVLDYGCGPGRIVKEILKQNPEVYVEGVDASPEMLQIARENVAHENFVALAPDQVAGQYQVIYCVYVLQHVPAIEIRELLRRIYDHLADDGTFIYCSSSYRMAIRFDGKGFFDDRFLGVDLIEEVERKFIYQKDLFDENDKKAYPILRNMIDGAEGGLAHPARVYRKYKADAPVMIDERLEAAYNEVNASINIIAEEKECTSEKSLVGQLAKVYKDNKIGEPKKLILVNRLAPGDCLVMTNAIRDLHLAHPGKYLTDVRTPGNEIFENNPYITKLSYSEVKYKIIEEEFSKASNPEGNIRLMGDILVIDAQYPLIHQSGKVGAHFGAGHREYLERVLEVKIPLTAITPELYLTQNEMQWPAAARFGVDKKYWVINAGSKNDFTLKQYHRYQEVVDSLSYTNVLIQMGQKSHNHVPLRGTVDALGQTSLRQLFSLIYQAEGVITCVSLPMHVAAAFRKPCVVVAGAREGTRWELYPNHQFIYVNGCLPCASYDGCWKNSYDDCNNKVKQVPKCLTLIHPDNICQAVERYYEGGMLTREYR